MLAGNGRLISVLISSHTQSHYDFFQGSVSRALANTVDRAFHLTGPGFNRR
jgi:hypothetical protein